jgi:hypothetical protein
MALQNLSDSHKWSRQQVRLNGVTYTHWQCLTCRRDFVRPSMDGGEWRAVHVGGLGFDYLDEDTTRRWVSEECSGRQLPGEENDARIRRS